MWSVTDVQVGTYTENHVQRTTFRYSLSQTTNEPAANKREPLFLCLTMWNQTIYRYLDGNKVPTKKGGGQWLPLVLRHEKIKLYSYIYIYAQNRRGPGGTEVSARFEGVPEKLSTLTGFSEIVAYVYYFFFFKINRRVVILMVAHTLQQLIKIDGGRSFLPMSKVLYGDPQGSILKPPNGPCQ